MNQWVRVSRAADTLPDTTTETIFTIAGGRIHLRALIGEVVTAISGGTTPDVEIFYDKDGAAAAVDLADDLAITSDAAGTVYSVEGDGTALLESTGGFGRPLLLDGLILGPGVIQWDTTESSISGTIKWDLYYTPLDPAAYVYPSAV